MSVKKIFYNTLLQSLGKVISVAIGLFTIALLSRYLQASGFGEYTTVVSFMGFFGILADLGMYLVTVQEISKEGADEKKILGNIFSLRFVTVIGMLFLGAIIALFFPYSQQVKVAMFWGIAAFTFVSGTQVLVGVFQKHLIFYKLSASEIIQRLVALATTIWFIRLSLGLNWFLISLVLSNAVHFFICLVITRRLIPFKLEFDLVFWKHILSKSWPLAFSVVLNLIYFKADTLILSALKSPGDVGIYGLSYKILEVLIAFPAMFAGLIMPFLARFAFTDWGQYRKYLQKSFDAMILVIVLMITVTLFFARPIINLVGGNGFAQADKVLMILILATATIYLGNLLGYTVVALNAQKKMVWGYLLGSVLGLALYFLLIPHFSYYGAAWATVVVELTVFVFAYFLTSRVSKFYPSFKILLPAILAALPMLAVFYFVNLNWVIEVVAGTVVYGMMLWALGAIPKEFIREILNKKSGSEIYLES